MLFDVKSSLIIFTIHVPDKNSFRRVLCNLQDAYEFQVFSTLTELQGREFLKIKGEAS